MADWKKLHTWQLCVVWTLNKSRQTPRKPAEYQVLQKSIARFGWMESQPPMMGFDKKSAIWSKVYEQMLDDELVKRQAKYNELRLDKSEDGRLEQEFYEKLWGIKDGKIPRPTFLVNAAISRGTILPDALHDRYFGFTYDGTVYQANKECSFEIPVMYQVYDTEDAREDSQSDENQYKDFGNVKPSDYDCLLWCDNAMKTRPVFSMQDAKIRFPGTVGQRNWQLCKLARLWSPSCKNRFANEPEREDAKLVTRCDPTYLNKDGFKIQLFNQTNKLTWLINRSTPDGLARLNEAILKRNDDKRGTGAKPEELEVPLTRDELEIFIGTPKAKQGSKTIDRETWQVVADNGKNDLAVDLAKNNLRKDTKTINHLDRYAEIYNPVYGDLNNGKEVHLSRLMHFRNDPCVIKILDLLADGKIKSEKILDVLSKVK